MDATEAAAMTVERRSFFMWLSLGVLPDLLMGPDNRQVLSGLHQLFITWEKAGCLAIPDASAPHPKSTGAIHESLQDTQTRLIRNV